jgi:phosphoesterase RecJ-like protein
VEAAVFLRELPEQRVRLSLRSKGRVNVSAIAARLGGGGHENASGVTLDGPISRALDEILAELRPSVEELAREPQSVQAPQDPFAWENRELGTALEISDE